MIIYYFVRPDCLYKNKLDLKYLDLVNSNRIVVPNFHLYRKINDRFAITNKKTYKIYGQIFLQLLDLSKKMSLHSRNNIRVNIKEK